MVRLVCSELVQICFRFGADLAQIWLNVGSYLVQIWFMFGSGVVPMWFRLSSNWVLIWISVGSDLAQILFKFVSDVIQIRFICNSNLVRCDSYLVTVWFRFGSDFEPIWWWGGPTHPRTRDYMHACLQAHRLCCQRGVVITRFARRRLARSSICASLGD